MFSIEDKKRSRLSKLQHGHWPAMCWFIYRTTVDVYALLCVQSLSGSYIYTARRYAIALFMLYGPVSCLSARQTPVLC